mmetsp:Transcript_7443/g.12578  ORF Transcript_7443/g.12578 Transcript_7443/m.12578 type:complete len:121 (+) Transcript_7443:844-1206(+)
MDPALIQQRRFFMGQYFSQVVPAGASTQPQKQRQDIENNLIQCSWSDDDKYVAVGTSQACDRLVYIWDSVSGQLVSRLGGHKGSVNDVKVVRAGREKEHGESGYLVASASSDKSVIIGQM